MIQKLNNNTYNQGEIIKGKYVLDEQLLSIYNGFYVSLEDRDNRVLVIAVDEPLQARLKPHLPAQNE